MEIHQSELARRFYALEKHFPELARAFPLWKFIFQNWRVFFVNGNSLIRTGGRFYALEKHFPELARRFPFWKNVLQNWREDFALKSATTAPSLPFFELGNLPIKFHNGFLPQEQPWILHQRFIAPARASIVMDGLNSTRLVSLKARRAI